MRLWEVVFAFSENCIPKQGVGLSQNPKKSLLLNGHIDALIKELLGKFKIFLLNLSNKAALKDN